MLWKVETLVGNCSTSIIDLFENFLNGLGVVVPNDEKQEQAIDGIEPCNIYGTQYCELDDKICDIIRNQVEIIYLCGKRDAYDEVIRDKEHKYG